MSLKLDRSGTSPQVTVKTWSAGHVTLTIALPEEEGTDTLVQTVICMEDFLDAAMYVLTNTDLTPDDPRLAFVERVKALGVVPGWNQPLDHNAKRLGGLE